LPAVGVTGSVPRCSVVGFSCGSSRWRSKAQTVCSPSAASSAWYDALSTIPLESLLSDFAKFAKYGKSVSSPLHGWFAGVTACALARVVRRFCAAVTRLASGV
jgi:hypothetical protein